MIKKKKPQTYTIRVHLVKQGQFDVTFNDVHIGSYRNKEIALEVAAAFQKYMEVQHAINLIQEYI